MLFSTYAQFCRIACSRFPVCVCASQVHRQCMSNSKLAWWQVRPFAQQRPQIHCNLGYCILLTWVHLAHLVLVQEHCKEWLECRHQYGSLCETKQLNGTLLASIFCMLCRCTTGCRPVWRACMQQGTCLMWSGGRPSQLQALAAWLRSQQSDTSPSTIWPSSTTPKSRFALLPA